ncbi:MAG: GTPase HflX [Clostridiales bacterium]|nr:GTPase HflX [Clostridiales bacterium]
MNYDFANDNKNENKNEKYNKNYKYNEITDENKKEQTVLISVDTGEFDAEQSIGELRELVKTAGGESICEIIQKRDTADGVSFIGKGRLSELKEFCDDNDVDLIVADSELSPVQVRNIEDSTNTRVIDRTTLILDIFASRARSKEGKLQIELAQLNYTLPRLSGKGKSLSRLGGGIGTRGPGETKLETDKRHIRRRIQYIKNELEQLEKRRDIQHRRRKKNNAKIVAIVGYTNAGKSTLMNYLTDAGVLQEDKLFATLDPTARKLYLPDGQQIMIVDTVGFISRLPHQLVEAFKSTLEEATYADVILNVCDASSPDCYDNISVTNDILESLFGGVISVPVINVFNKCDIAVDFETADVGMAGALADNKSVKISAKTGWGINNLLLAVQSALPQTRRRVRLLLPFDKGNLTAQLHRNGVVHSQEYTENGILIDATAEISFLNTVKDLIIDDVG